MKKAEALIRLHLPRGLERPALPVRQFFCKLPGLIHTADEF